jgi:hypothetical protein
MRDGYTSRPFNRYVPHGFSPIGDGFCELCLLRFHDHPYWEEELATYALGVARVLADLCAPNSKVGTPRLGR